MTLTINIDSDGVVYNMQAVLAARAHRIWPDNPYILKEPNSWSIGEAWAIDERDIRRLFEDETKKGLFSAGEAYDGAIEAVRRLAEKHRVRIVTNKGEMNGSAGYAIRDTVDFYERHGLLSVVDLIFIRDDHKDLHKADVVVDDNPGLLWMQPRALNLLFNRPWNATAINPGSLPVIRTDGWGDIERRIAKLEKQMSQGIDINFLL